MQMWYKNKNMLRRGDKIENEVENNKQNLRTEWLVFKPSTEVKEGSK